MMCEHAAWNGKTTFCPSCRRAPNPEVLQSLQVSPAATPSRRRWVNRKPQGPSWEKGRAGEHRPDGSFMPYLSPRTGQPMGVKEYADNRGNFDAQVRRLKSDPNVLARERAETA